MEAQTTKGKIVEAMYQLIAEKGYDKASIGQISEAIGIKKASVYYYFKSKEDIFLQMVRELYADDYSDRIAFFREKHTPASYQEALIGTGEEFIDSYFENQDLRKVYAEIDIQTTRIVELKELIQANDRSFNRFLIQCITHGVMIGAFPKDFDIEINAQILYTVLIGIDQAILYDLHINPKEVWKKVILKMFEGKVL